MTPRQQKKLHHTQPQPLNPSQPNPPPTTAQNAPLLGPPQSQKVTKIALLGERFSPHWGGKGEKSWLGWVREMHLRFGMKTLIISMILLTSFALHADPINGLSCRPRGDAIGPISIELKNLDPQNVEIVMTIVGEKIDEQEKADLQASLLPTEQASSLQISSDSTQATPTTPEVDRDADDTVIKTIPDQVGALAKIDGATESAQNQSIAPLASTAPAPTIGNLKEQGQMISEISPKDLKTMTRLGRYQFLMKHMSSVEVSGQFTSAALLDLTKEKVIGKGRAKKTLMSGMFAYRGAVYPLECTTEIN